MTHTEALEAALSALDESFAFEVPVSERNVAPTVAAYLSAFGVRDLAGLFFAIHEARIQLLRIQNECDAHANACATRAISALDAALSPADEKL